MNIKIKRIADDRGRLPLMPKYQTDGAAGMDFHAFLSNSITIPPGHRGQVSTGISVEIPENHVGIVTARSSMGLKWGVCLSNAIGVVDSDFRGAIQVTLQNNGQEDFVVCDGDRIAQLIIMPVVNARIIECDELSETERGSGGFGSTGK